MPGRDSLRSPSARILAAALAALVVAQLATLVLAPTQPGPPATSAAATDYFSVTEIARGEDYRGDTRLIGLVGLLAELGLLAAAALWRPAALRGPLSRLERRPLLGAALLGVVLSLTLALALLPLGFWVHQLAVDVGISVQGTASWLFDRARSIGIGALYAGAGALLLVLLQRRMPRRWWLAGAGVIVAFAAIVSFLAPLVIAPIFNDFERLEEGELRSDVLELAAAADVEIGEVYSVDASKRRTSLNAYVSGIGSTRRVVIYDTLVDSADRGALRSVVAHELAHVRHHDIRNGILFVLIVSPLGMLFVRELGGAVAARAGSGPGRVGAVPAYALALSIAALGIGMVSNQLSRAVEERADRFALELTGDPEGLIELQTDLVRRNVNDPDPPGWSRFLFSTHPPTVDRLGLAEAYRAREG